MIKSKFIVSALARATLNSVFPETVKVFRTHYGEASLLEAIKGHDVVMPVIATFSTQQQKTIVDVVAKVGVKRFIPSEYSVDT